MKWFDDWFQRQCKKAWYTEQNKNTVQPSLLVAKDDQIDLRKSIQLKMQPAHGGTIVEVSHYNETKCDYERELYIIPYEKDLSSEISSILVHYNLRNS